MSVHINQAAADRMKAFLDARGHGLGIRLGVQTSGCSGMAYVIEYVDEKLEDDIIFEQKGIKLFINQKAMLYLDNIQIDYEKKGLNEGFKFINPNAQAECGCGESFTV